MERFFFVLAFVTVAFWAGSTVLALTGHLTPIMVDTVVVLSGVWMIYTVVLFSMGRQMQKEKVDK